MLTYSTHLYASLAIVNNAEKNVVTPSTLKQHMIDWKLHLGLNKYTYNERMSR